MLGGLRAGTCDWVVFTYKSKTELVLLSQGSDGLAGMTTALEERNVNYAMLRVEKEALNARDITSEIERYVFVQWMPEGCSPMLRGAVNSHRGAVRQIFNPFQVDMAVESADELAEDTIFKELEATTSGH